MQQGVSILTSVCPAGYYIVRCIKCVYAENGMCMPSRGKMNRAELAIESYS